MNFPGLLYYVFISEFERTAGKEIKKIPDKNYKSTL